MPEGALRKLGQPLRELEGILFGESRIGSEKVGNPAGRASEGADMASTGARRASKGALKELERPQTEAQ